MKAKRGALPPEPSPVRLFPRSVISLGVGLQARLGPAFRGAKVHPNVITFFGLASGLAAGALFAFGSALAGSLGIILCGLLDVLDGTIAVQTGRQTRFGAILDSSLDRYSEFFIYAGLAYRLGGPWTEALAAAAFLGSVMVSYTRARAEGLGFTCQVGIMQRAERLAVLCLAGLIGTGFKVTNQALVAGLGFIALFSHVSAWQRIFKVRSLERKEGRPRT